MTIELSSDIKKDIINTRLISLEQQKQSLLISQIEESTSEVETAGTIDYNKEILNIDLKMAKLDQLLGEV